MFHLEQACLLERASRDLFALDRPETALALGKEAVNECRRRGTRW